MPIEFLEKLTHGLSVVWERSALNNLNEREQFLNAFLKGFIPILLGPLPSLIKVFGDFPSLSRCIGLIRIDSFLGFFTYSLFLSLTKDFARSDSTGTAKYGPVRLVVWEVGLVRGPLLDSGVNSAVGSSQLFVLPWEICQCVLFFLKWTNRSEMTYDAFTEVSRRHSRWFNLSGF